MTRRGGAHRRVLADARGSVMLEFLIAIVPLLVLFLGLLQLALLAVADLVVRHAAITGARAASVVLYDDPRYYAGAVQGQARDADERAASTTRMAEIRAAVQAPLAAIAPGTRVTSPLAELGDYLRATTAITFPSAPDSELLLHDLAHAETVTVRVTHLLPCAVPLAGWLLCKRFGWSSLRQRLELDGADARTRRAIEELRNAPGAQAQQKLARKGVPLAVLQAEASVPAQAAPYRYASEQRE